MHSTQGANLSKDVGHWPTIRAAESGGYQYSRGDRNKPVLTLTGLALAYGPSSRPVRATSYGAPSRNSIHSAFRRYRAMTCSSMRAEMRALIRMAIRAERAGQRRGFTRPSYRKSLNARFVAWLMGWPDHWARTALMPSACSATALSLWRQAMRSALSGMPMPPAPGAVQTDLLG